MGEEEIGNSFSVLGSSTNSISAETKDAFYFGVVRVVQEVIRPRNPDAKPHDRNVVMSGTQGRTMKIGFSPMTGLSSDEMDFIKKNLGSSMTPSIDLVNNEMNGLELCVTIDMAKGVAFGASKIKQKDALLKGKGRSGARVTICSITLVIAIGLLSFFILSVPFSQNIERFRTYVPGGDDILKRIAQIIEYSSYNTTLNEATIVPGNSPPSSITTATTQTTHPDVPPRPPK